MSGGRYAASRRVLVRFDAARLIGRAGGSDQRVHSGAALPDDRSRRARLLGRLRAAALARLFRPTVLRDESDGADGRDRARVGRSRAARLHRLRRRHAAHRLDRHAVADAGPVHAPGVAPEVALLLVAAGRRRLGGYVLTGRPGQCERACSRQYSVSLPWHRSWQSQTRNSRLGSSASLLPHFAHTRAFRGGGENAGAVFRRITVPPRIRERGVPPQKRRKSASATATAARVAKSPVTSE